MNDAVTRAFRTFLQAFVGTLAIALIPFLNTAIASLINAEPYVFDFSIVKNIGLAAILSGVIALISYVQNELEDATGKSIPPK